MGEDDSDLAALPAACAGSPSAQSLAKPSLEEPDAGILHVRICAGAVRLSTLGRPYRNLTHAVRHRCYALEMTLVRWTLAVSLAALALGCFSPCPQSRATLAHPTMTTDPVEIGMGARVRP